MSAPAAAKETKDLSHTDLLLVNLQRFFELGKYSDVTIKTVNAEHKVHKAILCTQSEYFERLFENEWKETQENVISFPEDEPEVIKAMIDYMYGYDYIESCKEIDIDILFHAKLYSAADKYLVPALKRKAKGNFERRADSEWNCSEVLDAIPVLYNSFPLHADTLLKDLKATYSLFIQYVMTQQDFRKMLKDVPQFGFDLLDEVAVKHAKKWVEINCSKCEATNILVKPGDTMCQNCFQQHQASKKRKTGQ